jgi:ribosome-associated protein
MHHSGVHVFLCKILTDTGQDRKQKELVEEPIFLSLLYNNGEKLFGFRFFFITLHTNCYTYERFYMEQTNTLVKTIIKGIQEKKGTNIVVADLDGIEGTICRQFVVCQGNTPTQVDAITESIDDMVRTELREKPAHMVGRENALWVAMDYGDVLVHVFVPDMREYYDLEHLWEDAKLTRIPELD